MIDIHTHILPGLDDGARDLAESLTMARAAVADGLRQVVATPHSSWGAGRPERVKEQSAAVQLALDAEGIALRVVTGAEVWLSPDVAEQYRTGGIASINGGPYILVEFPPHQIPRYAEQALFELQVAGLRPVLAHPERYSALEDNLDPLYNLVGRGVLGQVTAGSLLGEFGAKVKELSGLMVAHGLVHVIASDAHDATDRRPVLSAAVKRAAQLVGPERAQAMVTTTPECIVEGRAFEAPAPIPLRRQWRPWGGAQ